MKPKFLKENSSIYLIAPSFGCTTSPYKQRLNRSIKNLKKMGYSINIGDNVYKDEGCAASSTPQNRALEFMKAYESSSDVILSVGGGETMVEMLEYVDFDRIRSLPPKWFVGFSDNTNLTFTLTTNCDIQTIYGNNAPNFYMYPFVYDTKDTIRMLQGEQEFVGYPQFQLRETKKIYPQYNFDQDKTITPIQYTSSFSGVLLGGCLDCLSTLCGTRFDKTREYTKNKDIIFYLEACDLNSIGIRRALFQLKNAGWFDTTVGFLIGRSLQYTDTSFGITPKDAYVDMLKSFNKTILLDIDLGHISPSLPMKNGAYATVSYENENIKITYKD